MANAFDIFSTAGTKKAGGNTWESGFTNVGPNANLGGFTPEQRKTFYGSNPTAQEWQSVLSTSGVPYGAIAADVNSLMGTDINPITGWQSIYGVDSPTLAKTLTEGNPADIAAAAAKLGINPADISSWANDYLGSSFTPESVAQYLGMSNGGTGFNIPTNLFPTSTSQSGSSSQSGIDWNSDLGKALLPMLIQQAKDLPGMADQIGSATLGKFTNMLKQATGPEGFQGTINDLASRGMIESSVAGDAMARTRRDLTTDIQNKGFDAILASLMAKLQVPGMLGSMAGLAQTTTSSTGSSTQQSNPLAPYELAASIISGPALS